MLVTAACVAAVAGCVTLDGGESVDGSPADVPVRAVDVPDNVVVSLDWREPYSDSSHRFLSRLYKPTFGSRFPKLHQGIDFEMEAGSPVISVAHGRVVSVKSVPCLGTTVVVRHTARLDPRTGEATDGIAGSVPVYLVCAHLAGTEVQRHQLIGPGDILGRVSTLCAGNAHVHFGMLSRFDAPDESLNPHRYWRGGPGRVSCFDKAAPVPKNTLSLSAPVPCDDTDRRPTVVTAATSLGLIDATDR